MLNRVGGMLLLGTLLEHTCVPRLSSGRLVTRTGVLASPVHTTIAPPTYVKQVQLIRKMSLSSFIAESRASLAKADTAHIFVGNEACDADTIISAISYAFHNDRLGTSTGAANAVPLIPCSRDDLALRREAMWLLEQAVARDDQQAVPSDWKSALVCLDDYSSGPLYSRIADLASRRALSVTLLDHNQLKGPLEAAGCGAVVTDIVDHHMDTGAHPQVMGGRRNISFDLATMKGVGSTCTLVAQAMLASDTITHATAYALLGVILLDTVCLDPAAGKVTPADEAAVQQLVAFLEGRREAASVAITAEGGQASAGTDTAAHNGVMIDIKALYGQLQALKTDPTWWASLSPAQAIGYDYKSFSCPGVAVSPGGAGTGRAGAGITFGSSSLMMPLQQFLVDTSTGQVRPDVLAAIGQQATAQSLSFTVLLSMVMTDGPGGPGTVPTRQMVIVVPATLAPGLDRRLVLDVVFKMTSQLASEASGLRLEPLVAGGGAAAHDGVNVPAQLAPAMLPTGQSGAIVLAYKQGNAKASRKQVVPLVISALESMK